MNVETDLRVLKAIERRYGFKFDREFKYCLDDNNHFGEIHYNGEIYRLIYCDGCFYPYLVWIGHEPYPMQHIQYSDGSNPYLCFTKKELKRLKKKYGNMMKKVKENFWYVTIPKEENYDGMECVPLF